MLDIKKIGGCLLVLLAGLAGLALAGCGAVRTGDGSVMYDIIYASGYSRDPYAKDAAFPVDGTDWLLTLTEAGLPQLMSEDGLPGIELAAVGGLAAPRGGSLGLRAEAGPGQTLWLCAEQWGGSRYNGYIDGTLRGGQLYLLSAEDGSLIFQAATQPEELFLTACGTRCYFYSPGKSSRRRADWRQAQIYWRDMLSWPLPHEVCSFDYVERPQFTDGEGNTLLIDRLRFYIRPETEQEEVLRLDFTCYEQTDAEHDRWSYAVKSSVTTPLQAGWPLLHLRLPEQEPEHELATTE